MFLIRWLWKNMLGFRRRYILAFSLSIICQSMFIINPFIIKNIVDTFISGENAAVNLAERKSLLFALLALTVAVAITRSVIQYSANMLYEVCSQGLVYKVRAYLFDNVQSQDASFFDYYRTGDIMTRLSGDIEMVRHSIAWVFKAMIESTVLFTASVIFFFSLNPLLALCLLALTPLVFIISFVFRRKVGPMYGDLRDRLSELNTAAEENISGNRVVKAFANEEFENDKFKTHARSYAKANKKTALTWLKFFLPMEITSQSLLVIHLIVGGLFVISERMTIGSYMAFSMLIWTLTNPMSMLGNIINDFQRFTASANKIIEVYYSHPKIVDRNDAIDLNERLKGDIEFKNVSFKYGDSAVLKDINFKINAGETVAIMGETGSGKTSLVNLIPRIYDPNAGEVIIDGHNIKMLKLKQLRSNIAISTQDVLLYSDTIEGNIAFGNIDMPMEEVYARAIAADADNFIRETSDGYDTIIGERGVGLSGGQKQRIALARALAVKPSILILDDTTSAVDSETEERIQESLLNLDFPCTKIIIAARISSAKDADKIIVLKDGKIAEAGTHAELLENGGYYREVYDLQM